MKTSPALLIALIATVNVAGLLGLVYSPAYAKPQQITLPGFNGMSVPALKQFANDKYWADDYSTARSAIESLLSRSNCSLKHLNHECLEIYMNLAVCDMQENKLDKAKAILHRLLNFARLQDIDNHSEMDEPDCLFFLAECYYRNGSYKHAETLYANALAKYRKSLPALSTDLSPCLDGLAGCLFRRNCYAEALPLFAELAKIDALNRGADDLTTAWSLLSLSDVLKHLNKCDEAAPLYEKAIYTFRQTNADRILAKHASMLQGVALENMKVRVRDYIFGNADCKELASGGEVFAELTKDLDYAKKPPQRPNDFYNWRLKRVKVTEAPGLVTMNPNIPLKGLIVCVHGLGLHHGTYQLFAEQMAERGFGVIAFDVRGFGSYRKDKGYDKVDLNSCVEDIGDIVKLLRRDYPDKTIFLLGESMGGAIALQVASKHDALLDGLVCSVPSGSRFGATKTNIGIAMRLLTHKDKPFDISKPIVAKATRKESLRQQWREDPEARLMLSATELVRFQKFMNHNLKAAEQLKDLPVILFQGYGDKLIKPEGTLALYNALTTEDKDLVFVGHSEHLIFEEGQFKPAIINGLNGWLCSHLKDNAVAQF